VGEGNGLVVMETSRGTAVTIHHKVWGSRARVPKNIQHLTL